MDPKEQLKKIRRDHFYDSTAEKRKRENDPRYIEALEVQKKAKKLLDKANGR